jgi:alanine racemase
MTHSPSHITINTSALQDNYKLLKSRIPVTCQAATVVKANAYGLGVDCIVPALEQAGARFFYVAHFSEALKVREVTGAPIAVLGGLPKGAAGDYKHHKIIPVLNSAEDIDYCPADLPAIWHIDTGMNRLGLQVSDVQNLTSRTKSLPIMMMTHFTSSDDASSAHTSEQVKKFDVCIAGLPKPFQIMPQSICNSSGIFRSPHPTPLPQGEREQNKNSSPLMGEDLGEGVSWFRHQVRPGIALYGGNPTPETTNPMKAVVSLDTQILQTRHAKQGETVGYNQTETLTKDTLLATVGLGYADGFFRTGSSRAKFYWHGQPCKIMGRVSMDTIIVDIGQTINCPSPKQGDWLEVIGNHQSVDRLASDLGTISYEVMTSLSRRAERIV